jgi:homoprotocatechuate degradation regulator HpaR
MMKRSRKQVGSPLRATENPVPGPSPASRQLPVLLFALYDLTDPQWRVLRILSQADELDVSTLAHRSYLMRESLSRILRDLGERGLIVRRVSDTDARRFCHTLTAKGRQLLEEVSPAFNPVYKEIEARVGVERIEELNKRLAQLLEAIEMAE